IAVTILTILIFPYRRSRLTASVPELTRIGRARATPGQAACAFEPTPSAQEVQLPKGLVFVLDNLRVTSQPRNLCRSTLQIRCFYAWPRRFLNRVRRFNSCRGMPSKPSRNRFVRRVSTSSSRRSLFRPRPLKTLQTGGNWRITGCIGDAGEIAFSQGLIGYCFRAVVATARRGALPAPPTACLTGRYEDGCRRTRVMRPPRPARALARRGRGGWSIGRRASVSRTGIPGPGRT